MFIQERAGPAGLPHVSGPGHLARHVQYKCASLSAFMYECSDLKTFRLSIRSGHGRVSALRVIT